MSNELSPKCPQCGTPLPADAPKGLCPKCLMALNLKTETVFTDDTPAAQPPLPPEQIAPHFPQLEILECLGRGGMGVVYKARQKSLNRFVALKLLAPERVNDAKFAERFAREAQALAVLNHPNIVTIYDFGQAGGFYYLLMEFVDGLNLRQLLRTRKFTPEEALAIVPPLCDALQFAHDRGIVHRDIKPENLLLDKAGRVKVADFGIAKMFGTVNASGNAGEPAAPENATQTAVGTPSYSAPEQKSDPQRVDSRADIYSLGVVFYEMLTGELPGKTIAPPSTKVQIDVRLDEVVLRALEQKPELRYQQVSEVKTQVETIVATPPGSSRREEAQNEKTESRRVKAEKTNADWRQFLPFLVAMPLLGGGVYWLATTDLSRGQFFIAMLLLPTLPLLIILGGMRLLSDTRNVKAEIENRKSEIVPRFSRTAIAVTILALIIIGAIVALTTSRSHYSTPAMELSQSDFLNKFQSNEIAHATITVNEQTSPLVTITGTYFKTDKDGGLTKEEVPFAVNNAWLRPEKINVLLVSDRVKTSAQNVRLKNLVWGIAPFIILGVGILLVPGIIIYVVWCALKKTRGHSAPPPIQKPDRFWRWFAVAVFAFISIPFVIALFGLLAAIAIPNFVKGRAQAQANAQHAAQNISAGLTAERVVKSPPFLAHLPDGGSIELLAVRTHSSTNKPWWQPDGSPSTFDSTIEPESPDQFSGDLMALVKIHYPSVNQKWPLPAGGKNPAGVDIMDGPGFALKDGRRLLLEESDTNAFTMFGVMKFAAPVFGDGETTLFAKPAVADWQTVDRKR